MEEVWADIDGFPGYQISNLGNARSFRDFHGKIASTPHHLKLELNKDDYYQICLYTLEHKKVHRRIHRLVLDAFVGPQPDMVANHIDGNKHNNVLTNLEWVTPEQNSTLASEAGLYKTIPVRIVETNEVFNSIKECADALGIHPSNISAAFSNKNKTVRDLHVEKVATTVEEKKETPKEFLYDYQMDAVKQLRNGSILCGSVGSGKSRTGLYYYFKEQGGWFEHGTYTPMDKPKDLIIITTAKKRNSLEWEKELGYFRMTTQDDLKIYNHEIIVDSWNNIGKYKDRVNSFFLLDEQRLVSNGAWVKAFLKIAKNNDWILLTATPADTYQDYIPVFIANGFFKNRTEFNREHVIYSRFSKYPKIDRYINTRRLDRLRNKVLVKMNYKHEITTHHEDVYCSYDMMKYRDVVRTRWDPFKNEPIAQASGLCYTLRRVVNSDVSRQIRLLEILEDHPRIIVFYNFSYELDILRGLYYGDGVEVAEYNGQKHQPLPSGLKWVYLCQYTAACEGWECIQTNTIVFYSQNYSYKVMTQAAGRVDRLNTPFQDLYYYHLKSRSGIDLAISRALSQKKKFNESGYVKW